MGRGRLFGPACVTALARILVEPDGALLSRAELAARLGVHRTTVVRHYREALAMADHWRTLPVTEEDLVAVDRSIVEQAKAGHVGAARLVYLKMMPRLGVQDALGPPTEVELEEALALVRQRAEIR